MVIFNFHRVKKKNTNITHEPIIYFIFSRNLIIEIYLLISACIVYLKTYSWGNRSHDRRDYDLIIHHISLWAILRFAIIRFKRSQNLNFFFLYKTSGFQYVTKSQHIDKCFNGTTFFKYMNKWTCSFEKCQ